MTKAEQQVALLLKSSISGSKVDFTGITLQEAEDILVEADRQSVSIICYNELQKATSQKLSLQKKPILKALAAGVQIEYAYTSLAELLKANGIRYCFIKGCASAYYYNSPTNRKMGDVDVLINNDDLVRATKLLKNSGYLEKKRKQKSLIHKSFEKDRISVELHTSVSYLSEKSVDIKGFTKGIVATARPCKLSQGEVLIPNAFYHGIIILLHMYRHFVNGGFGLRHLYDWAVFVNSEEYDAVADDLEKVARNFGVCKFMQTASAVSVNYLGVTNKKSFAEIDKKLCEAFFEYVVKSGNFGRKKDGKVSKLFVGNSLNKANSNNLSSYMTSMRQKVLKRWPEAEKNCFIYFLRLFETYLEFAVRIIKKERKMPNIAKDIKEAKKTKQLFYELSDK